jgi:2-keto-4-pentenoate hydratase
MWDSALPHADLASLKMTIHQNGTLAAEGVGAAALGHPARSTAWLANKLVQLGTCLRPYDIVISGGLTKMLPVKSGDEFVFALTGQPSMTIVFT